MAIETVQRIEPARPEEADEAMADVIADGQVVGFKRTGHVALFRVADVEFDQNGLRFRFVERLAELE